MGLHIPSRSNRIGVRCKFELMTTDKGAAMNTELATENAKQTDTNRIEKRVVLRAAQDRVWRAMANAQELGEW